MLSFAGTVTFANATALREAAARHPGRADPGRDRRAVPDPGAEPRQVERARSGRAHRARARGRQADGCGQAVRGHRGDRGARLRAVAAVAPGRRERRRPGYERGARRSARPSCSARPRSGRSPRVSESSRRKRLGQNFVVDAGTVSRIAAHGRAAR